MSVPIYDLVAFQSRIRPEAAAVFCAEGVIRFRELMQHIDAMIGELQSCGIGGTEPVALIYPRCYVHLLLILALDRMNVPSVSLPAANTSIPWTSADPLVALSDTKPELDVPHRWIEIPQRWTPRHGAANVTLFSNPADSLVRVILSSASTGSAKAIAVRRSALTARIIHCIRDLALTPNSRAMPIHLFVNSPGYAQSLATLAAGGMVVLLRGPEDVLLQRAELVKITHLTCSPYELERLVVHSSKLNLPPLSSVDIMETTGGHLPLKLAQRAQEVLSRNLYSQYGATEVGRIAFMKVGSHATSEDAVGYVSPWCRVEIVDGSDAPLPPGKEGIMRVQTPGMIDSYFQDSEMTAKNLRDGWFYPGDIGLLSEDGRLRILGRMDDVVNLGGIKVSVFAAEERLRMVTGVKDVAVFGVTAPRQSERLWAAVVRAGAVDSEILKAAMIEAKISRAIYLEHLPRSESGKISRRKLIEAAHAILAREANAGEPGDRPASVQ